MAIIRIYMSMYYHNLLENMDGDSTSSLHQQQYESSPQLLTVGNLGFYITMQILSWVIIVQHMS